MKNFDIFSLQIRPTEIYVYLMNVTSTLPKNRQNCAMFIIYLFFLPCLFCLVLSEFYETLMNTIRLHWQISILYI